MHDHAPILDGRVRRHLAEKIRPAETTTVCQLDVEWAPVTDADGATDPNARPGVVGQGEPVSIAAGFALDYEPFEVGRTWGPPWGTTWLHLTATVPADLRGEHLELVVDLGGRWESPGFQSEGLVVRPDGSIIKALNPRNTWIPAEPDDEGRIDVYVEAASNPILLAVPPFQPTEDGDKLTASTHDHYSLERADLVVVHDEVRALVADVVTLEGLVEQLPEDTERTWQIRRGLDRAMDRLDLADVTGTASAARAELSPLLEVHAPASAQVMTAVGHAHIDSAWLWPLRETRRKVARTIANQLNLLDQYPEHVFAFPAAQHSAWLKEDHPDLFARLVDAVAAGRIVPVGGMWVESDANLPGGEAMCRQFLHGQRFFRDNFGRYCDEVWLPDSFGYCAALPQIARLAGAKWFLTQKISWNQVDKFPHHSFWWEGIDGTRIFTHFPPADTYGSDLSAHDLQHARTNFTDKGRSNTSLVPFGYGDGGGGPTREMLEQARRVADLDGSPRVVVEKPEAFFERAQSQHENPATWVGELYLELHRGTFTSQYEVKKGNRRNEHLLREAELWCATAAVRGLMKYPAERLAQYWRTICLYQFHDILPGTCISWVYREVIADHRRISDELTELIHEAQDLLVGAAPDDPRNGEEAPQVVLDAAPVRRPWAGSVALGGAAVEPSTAAPVEVTETPEGGWIVDNGLVRLAVDSAGRVTGLVDLASGRDAIPAGTRGNVLQLHPDFPNMWDAWDIDPFYANSVVELTDGVASLTRVGDGVEIAVTRSFGASTAVQKLAVNPGDPRVKVRTHLDWHEQDSLLKVAWPVDVHTDHARYEIEMGHVTRPTHANTSWDAYRFEVNAHRWVHVGEPGFGLAVANSGTYGWNVTRVPKDGGGTYSVVHASLLKGARFPDPRADQGEHDFFHTLHAGATIEDAVRDGYAANLCVRRRPGHPVAPLVSVEGAMVEAVKLAEDGSGDVVVRLYEPYGRRLDTTMALGFEATGVVETDLLEEPLEGNPRARVRPGAVTTPLDEGRLGLSLRPFQILTLRLTRSGGR
ncbi:alpha-mannosidase [Acidipropionibacterium timonense]|uniref:alpha-mannosidase n=1 Tax=Acidipropionibacterium timonense TaxID=2161818 RepID=UPI001030D55B|nr:glycoside hydrolase family 38 C-terminal domain-containing protein [Acidipropionibacterium timonense]